MAGGVGAGCSGWVIGGGGAVSGVALRTVLNLSVSPPGTTIPVPPGLAGIMSPFLDNFNSAMSAGGGLVPAMDRLSAYSRASASLAWE